MFKICTKCLEPQLIAAFYRDSRNKSGLQSWCKSCTIRNSTEWGKKNPEKRAASWNRRHSLILTRLREKRSTSEGKRYHKESVYHSYLKTKYGLTIDDLNKKVEAQNSRCAICDVSSEKLCVDHDHRTGLVRSLLCFRCNTQLGVFENRWLDFQQYLSPETEEVYAY